MADEYLVFVAGEEAPDRGDIALFTDATEAAGHAESLLEAGYDQSRIRVFSSREMDLHVTHRPVVSLADGTESDTSEVSEVPDSMAGEAADDDEGDGEVAGVKDGVRLSSLFKSE